MLVCLYDEYMIYIGMLLIIAAWVIQYRKKSREIVPMFLMLYVAGVALLVLDALLDRYFLLGIMNLTAGVMAFLVYRGVSVGGRRRR